MLLEGLQVYSLSRDYNTHLGEISLSRDEKGFTSTPAATLRLPGTVGSTEIRPVDAAMPLGSALVL